MKTNYFNILPRYNRNQFTINNLILEEKDIFAVYMRPSHYLFQLFWQYNYFSELMEESPQSKIEKVENCISNIQLQKAEDDECDYQSETMVFNEEPKPINRDLLKHILHRSIGALTFLNKYKKLVTGTGVLISKDIVLTAAHNVFNKKLNFENEDFKFYLGADGETKKYYEVEAWRYPEEYKACHQKVKAHFDYAIMKLKKPIEFDKYLSISLTCPECLLKDNKKTILQVFGFPSTYPQCPPYYGIPFLDNFKDIDTSKYGQKIKLNQYGLARKNRIGNIDAANFTICHGVSTLPGQVGSPLVVNNSIIGIHIGGETGMQFNVGRIIDEALIKSIVGWIMELGATPFSLEQKDGCQHTKHKILSTKQSVVVKTTPDISLDLQSQSLNRVDLSEYKNLLQLDLNDNRIKSIDLSHCPLLKFLNLSRNQLRIIDLAKCTKITQLYLYRNKIQKIDVSANTNLTHLNLSSNMLQKIKVGANINLTHLYLWNNQLKTIDISSNTNLTILDIHSNNLQKIDVNSNIQLTYLDLHSNRITEINISNNIKLERLRLQDNRLASICLCISENVQEKLYIDYFNISDQYSVNCLVQLKYNQQLPKNKAIKIAEKWRQKYFSTSWYSIFKTRENQLNIHNCKYIFKVV